MITAAQWVPRGFAAPFPQKYEFNEEEFERIADLAKLQLDDAEEDLKEAQDAENGESSKKDGDDSDMEVDGKKGSEKIEYVPCDERAPQHANLPKPERRRPEGIQPRRL